MIKAVEDLRPKYAAILRNLADRMEQSDKQPEGLFVEIFMVNRELVRAVTAEDGFDLLYAVGCFDLIRTELTNRMICRQKKI